MSTACRFNHPITIPAPASSIDMRTCSHFLRGNCRNGNACQYSHGIGIRLREVSQAAEATASIGVSLESPITSKRTIIPSTSVGLGICKFFVQGRCKNGVDCSFSHCGLESSSVRSPARRSNQQQNHIFPLSKPASKSACIYFAKGKCTNGVTCTFSHSDTATGSPLSINLQQTRANESTLKGSILVPCKFFAQGSCMKGDECQFFHPSPDTPTLSADIPSSFGAVQAPVRIIPAIELNPVTGPGISRGSVTLKAQEKTPNTNAVAVAERSMYKCAVTFGASAAIQRIITPFESCSVILSNLPPEITQAEVTRVAESFGDLARLTIEEPNKELTSPLKARVEYTSCNQAAQAVQNLNNMPFQSHHLSARLDLRAVENGSGTLISRKAKISWFAPSAIAWAHYRTIEFAKEQAARLDGDSFSGHRLSVSFQTPGYRQRTSFSIEIKGLPPNPPLSNLEQFCRTSSVTIREPLFDRSTSVTDVREALERHGHLEAFDVLPLDNTKTKVRAFVEFSTSEEATDAVKKLHGTSQNYLAGGRLWLEQVFSIKYNIPYRQFATIKDNLNSLQNTAGEDCKLRYHDRDENGHPATKVAIRIYAANPKALGSAKVEVEKLIRGELLVLEGNDFWDEYFDTSDGQSFLRTLSMEFSFFVKSDFRSRTIHLFGSITDRRLAREKIFGQIEDAKMRRHILPLKKDDLRALLTGHLSALHDEFGAETVVLDVVGLTLTIRGNDDEAKRISRLVSAMSTSATVSLVHATGDGICPVCFCDDLVSAIKLPCGHTYCMACLQHLGRSTSRVSFSPLRCVAEIKDDGSSKTALCRVDIPYSTIRELLSSTEESTLLEASFLSYIDTHPKEFRYCPTPDCQVVYRPSELGTVLQCPSCLIRICGACHVEFHEGLTCREHFDNTTSGGLEALQKWKAANGVKTCPQCKADIQKNGGCNHITCAICRAHICWVCMKVFADEDSGDGVYAHMQKVHGSISG